MKPASEPTGLSDVVPTGTPNAPEFKDVFTTPVSLTSNLLCPLSLVMENNVPVFVSEKAAMEVELDDSIFNTP